MANLNWVKTETGYADGKYTMTRTPGKRWVLSCDGSLLADGKQFAKLADAKESAQNHADMTRDMELPRDVVLGVEQRPDPTMTMGAESAPPTVTVAPPDAITVNSSSDGSCVAVPVAVDVLGYPAGQTVLTPADWGIRETPRGPSVIPVPVGTYARPEPRESLTDQFTRLYVYRDISHGHQIGRRYLRNSAQPTLTGLRTVV